jgi:hypothetical protein
VIDELWGERPPATAAKTVQVYTRPTQMGTCLVPLVPDNGYVLDFAPPAVPNRENVVIATAGWAFKFAPMFGKILAELAIEGESTSNIAPMSITRPGVLVDLYPGEANAAASAGAESVIRHATRSATGPPEAPAKDEAQKHGVDGVAVLLVAEARARYWRLLGHGSGSEVRGMAPRVESVSRSS